MAPRELDWTPGPGAAHPKVAPMIAAYEAQRRAPPRAIPERPTRSATRPPARKQKATAA